ncbi:hypothetical protein E1287_07240 [Actinomadura sp. KC06]|uniref:hypothetical protein n=1 Tax=Actinomadura sp. KC06 TaxID=2530369 RepID=UPI00105317E6|nr:hypothetical protein [Actinomadura sp. KC06]TDD37844.1 hypothetical protein E1287_07240 [Actinomadura sp. KC06]
MTDREFEITNDHLTLLRNAHWSWNDCEFGAPTIDPKRPYGNSSVIRDIAELLDIDLDDLDRDREDELSELHRETLTVLDIALATGSFAPGTYRYRADGWERVGDGATVLDVRMGENDAGAATIREYLTALLTALWSTGEGFSGKRPFGNSGWDWDLIAALAKAGRITATFDEDGLLDRLDSDQERKGQRLIAEAIRALGQVGR